MNIRTKFNRRQKVFIINNNEIQLYPIKSIEYTQGKIVYVLLIQEACTLNDKDLVVYREESDCFKTINALAKKYKEKLKL